MATSISGGRSWSTRRKPPTMGERLRVECTLFVIYKAGREPTPYWYFLLMFLQMEERVHSSNFEKHGHSSRTESKIEHSLYLLWQYVIKFASDLRQVDGFLRILRFLPSIKLTATI
jgi:hypothetical protein